ncbi:armadillo-type protein [Pavlovales sp. CCMP2436]|nr:armadillo-type protein [Pavlovales sp. CCMP2436]
MLKPPPSEISAAGPSRASQQLGGISQALQPRIVAIDSPDGRLRQVIQAAASRGDARELWTLCAQGKAAYEQHIEKGRCVVVCWWWRRLSADADIVEVIDISREQPEPVDLSGPGGEDGSADGAPPDAKRPRRADAGAVKPEPPAPPDEGDADFEAVLARLGPPGGVGHSVSAHAQCAPTELAGACRVLSGLLARREAPLGQGHSDRAARKIADAAEVFPDDYALLTEAYVALIRLAGSADNDAILAQVARMWSSAQGSHRAARAAEAAGVAGASAAVAAEEAPEAAEAAGEATAAIGAAQASRPEAGLARATDAELGRMPWPQLGAYLREHAALAGAAHAALAVRIVADRARNGEGDAAVAAGVLPALVAAMRAHAASAAVQERACWALIIITAAQGDVRKQAAADAGALPQIVAAMRAHAADAAVQERACWALIIITAGTGAQGDARRQAAADALPQIVAAMRAHAADAAVQEQACWALIIITAGTGTQGDARKQAAVDLGALPQIVEAMRAHATSAAVQAQAHDALRSIAAGTDAQVYSGLLAAIDAGSLPQIVEAMNQLNAAQEPHG